ncbi:diguanylate cyclase [Herbaspirillum sp. HC18]|nr:diguanylate cyclase [Herbaspirillum sp. HC18]
MMVGMFNVHSIKSRIVGLCLLMAAIGISVRHFIALPMAQEHLQQLVASQQLSVATYVARDIDQSVTARLTLISRFAADLPPGIVNNRSAMRAWIADRQRINPLFGGGLMAVPPDGKGLLGEYPIVEGRNQLDFSKSEWFEKAKRLGVPVMSKPYRGRASGGPLIVFAAPVRDATGHIVAVLAGTAWLNAPDFLSRLQDIKLGATGGFLLISPEDNLFVASTDPDMVLKPTPPKGVNLLHDRAMAGYRGTGVTVNAKGIEELSAMVTVPSTGWFVVARMPTAEAFRPIETLRRFVLGATALVLTVVLASLLVALTFILRPMMHTARAIRDMADGKIELAPLPVERNDEVGNLVSGFNYLVNKLRAEEAARRASEARLQFLAHHDSLTGLYNRAMLELHVEQALAHAERTGKQIALLYCDLDGFKPINDQHGHETGDAVLCEVARRLGAGRRRTDTVARLGGDEFVILLADLDDGHLAAGRVAEQCLTTVAAPFEHDGKIFTPAMSIGIAVHGGMAVEPSSLMSKADIALYRAKHAGKGRYCFIDEPEAPAVERIQHKATEPRAGVHGM